jgi:hypothetical protein
MLLTLSYQICWLLILAIPVACVAWTVTHEEIFREPRDYCERRCRSGKSIAERKFFYVFTCEYCFSHYVAIVFLFITRFQMLFDNWRGYLIAWLSLVWIANVYISLFGLIRTDLKKEKAEVKKMEQET